MNKVILIGRITKDIELRTVNTDKSVATYTLAIDRGYGDKKETDFINCVTWEKQAENIAKYCSKGSLIAIEGRMSNRSYDAKGGTKKYVTEVVTSNVQFLDTKKESGQVPREENTPAEEKNDPFTEFGQNHEEELNNLELPF